MDVMKNHLLILSFTLTLLSGALFSQDGSVAPKYSNEFLQIGVGARSLGMGNAMVAGVNDVTSVYWNPAGLTGVENKLDVSLMHSEYFAGIAKYDYIGLAHSIDEKSAVGFADRKSTRLNSSHVRISYAV